MEYHSYPKQDTATPTLPPTHESNAAPVEGKITYVELRLQDGTSIFIPARDTCVPMD